MDLLFIFKAVIIGIVEGITEFLPISSTGHMILFGNFIHFDQYTYSQSYIEMFMVVIQLGAILAVVVLYWNKIWNSLKNLAPGKFGFKLWTNIIIAFIPSAIVGLLIHDFMKEKLFGPKPVVFALIIGAFLMLIMENRYRSKFKTRDIDNVSVVQAFKIGCFQCLALWPGMSRSASTIMGAWVSGLSNVAAAEFSFFLAIPTMIAASSLELIKNPVTGLTSNELIALVIGFAVSFIVALLVIEQFIGFLKKKPMRVFAVYRLFIGIILLVLFYSNVLKV